MSHQYKAIFNRKSVQFIILILIVISVSIVSYCEYKSTLDKTTNKLNEKVIDFHVEILKHLTEVYKKDSKNNFVNAVMKNKKLRCNFEDMLRLIRISTVQNLFVLSRDKNKNYYFLLDSDKNQITRANILEPFNPLGDFWDIAYSSKKPQVFHHSKNRDLWITIAYPIVENNKTVALIGIDISHDLDVNIQTNLQNFSSFFIWILILGILWFVVLYLFTFYLRHKVYEGYIDPLTKIYNRKYLQDILLKKLSRNYQLFMVDIDYFKKVNDTYGHDAGDAILYEVAKRMKELMRDEDSLIRYGGEEFLIYTTKLTPEKSLQFAERLRKSIGGQPITYKNITCNITISIGINPYASKSKDFLEMLKMADEALYRAKAFGRNCVKIVN